MKQRKMAQYAAMSRNNRAARSGNAGPARPPGQGLSKNAKRRRNMRRMMNAQSGRMFGRPRFVRRRRARVADNVTLAKNEMLGGEQLRRGLLSVGPPTAIADTWQNSKDFRINRMNAEGLDMMSLGTTAVGRLAAAKALHPAANIGPQRWPDKSANESIVLQNTDVWIVTNNKVGTGPWNCNMWLTNFVDCPLITSSNLATGTWPNPQEDMKSGTVDPGQVNGKKYAFWYSTPWGDGWNPNEKNHPSKNFQEARITSRSITVDLVSNATSNQGVVYASQYGPNVAQMAYNQKTTVFSKEQVDILDKMFERFKVSLEKKDDALDEFELVDVFDRTTLNVLNPLNDPPANNQTGFRTVFQDWPYTPTQVMQVSPMSYMARADQGVYLPLKHAADELPYQQTALQAYLSAVVPHNEDGLTTQMDVLLSQGWNMGAVIFAGLAEGAQLAVKVITTLELTARSDSLMTKFTEEAPPLDKVAIDHARAAMGKLPDAFPAADNMLGGIVSWIAEALESSGIPLVSQAASFGRRIDKALGGAGTKFLDSIF